MVRERTKRLPGVAMGIAAAALVLGGVGNPNIGSQVFAAAGHVRSTSYHVAAPAGIATVRWIHHGLAVLPPHQGKKKGKLKMPLFSKYGLHTGSGDRASIAFHDGTLLHFNSNTDAVLTSPTSTKVKHGEVQEVLTPGTHHPVQTASGIGAAGGTVFDIKVGRGKTIVTVVEGALIWTTHKGKVLLKNDQQSIVKSGQKPGAPKKVNPATVTAWTKNIPGPAVTQKNVALDANGGHILDYSSQAALGRGNATSLIDGNPDQGWITASGQTSNQWVKIGFKANSSYSIGAIAVDPAVKGVAASSDVKDFQIKVATASPDDQDFTTVFSGTAQKNNSLQRFVLPHPVQARYVELVAVDNYGNTSATSVGELEVVGYGPSVSIPVLSQVQPCPGSAPGTSGDVGCLQKAVVLINQLRAQNGIYPLTLSLQESLGTGSCVGAQGHSAAMAATGSVWHTLAGHAAESFPKDVCFHTPIAGENVWHQLSEDDPNLDLQEMITAMSATGSSSCTGSTVTTACNLVSTRYYAVGVGIAYQDGVTYLTFVFLG